MKKLILILFMFFVFSCEVFAKDSLLEYISQPIKKQQEITKQIREELNLDKEQQKQMAKIDFQFYSNFLLKGDEIIAEVIKIKKLRKDSKYSKENFKLLKNEYKIVEKRIDDIWDEYDKDFKKILTFKQKAKYLIIKKQVRYQIKRKMKKDLKKREAELKKMKKTKQNP